MHSQHAHRVVPAYRQSAPVLIWKTNNGMWPGKKHIEVLRSVENQLVQVYRDKNMIRAYVNTPATAKLAIGEKQKCDHSVRFSKGSQKTNEN